MINSMKYKCHQISLDILAGVIYHFRIIIVPQGHHSAWLLIHLWFRKAFYVWWNGTGRPLMFEVNFTSRMVQQSESLWMHTSRYTHWLVPECIRLERVESFHFLSEYVNLLTIEVQGLNFTQGRLDKCDINPFITGNCQASITNCQNCFLLNAWILKMLVSVSLWIMARCSTMLGCAEFPYTDSKLLILAYVQFTTLIWKLLDWSFRKYWYMTNGLVTILFSQSYTNELIINKDPY